jgi:hypothetical protein
LFARSRGLAISPWCHAGDSFEDNGKPGPRGPEETPKIHSYGDYGACVLDPDGNNIEAGFRGPA